ncbi:MAG: hypothetical protein ACRDR6_10820 [Pseudonocardiaceae bacterium]
MNALIELTALSLCRPGLDATPGQVAAWYRAKGRIHEHLAADVVGPEQITELAYAATAYEHAGQLIKTGVAA